MEDLPELPNAPFAETPKLDVQVDEFGEEFSEGQMDDFDNEIIEDSGGTGSGPNGTQSFAEKMTVYKHEDKRLAVPQRWYWGNIVKRMLTHNKAHGYTGCVLIGMSGSGKTTLTNTLLHKIHEYGENYVYKWFNGHQLIEIDKHIQDLQVGVPHVMVFDDASYTLEDATKTQMATLANALTTIRHHVKSRVIIIFNIHYSRATKKILQKPTFHVPYIRDYRRARKPKRPVSGQDAASTAVCKEISSNGFAGALLRPNGLLLRKVGKIRNKQPFQNRDGFRDYRPSLLCLP
jgi:hypothetical protein